MYVWGPFPCVLGPLSTILCPALDPGRLTWKGLFPLVALASCFRWEVQEHWEPPRRPVLGRERGKFFPGLPSCRVASGSRRSVKYPFPAAFSVLGSRNHTLPSLLRSTQGSDCTALSSPGSLCASHGFLDLLVNRH